MLHHLRHILPEHWTRTQRSLRRDAERWRRLRIGQTVCFGSMQQKELSSRRLRVTQVKEYEFNEGNFSAFALSGEKDIACWMIVADTGDGQPYLAISRKLSPADLESLLDEQDFQTITHSSRLKQLFMRAQTPGLKDWITMRYERRIEGMRGKQREHELERVFEYELYVNDKNDRAIEIERFLDGHMDAYATLYRPITDILEVLDAPRPTLAVPSAPPPAPTKPVLAKPAPAPTPAPAPSAPPPVTPAQASLRDVEETRQHMQAKPAASIPRTLPPGRVECDLTTAWRLIDEALRNGMNMSDMVRKILGLPVQAVDVVSFALSLKHEDYVTLGKRYGIEPARQDEIRARIVKELEAFAGKAQ